MTDPSLEEDANDINTSVLELQDAFAAALRNVGILGKIRAQLRASAISIIRADPHLRSVIFNNNNNNNNIENNNNNNIQPEIDFTLAGRVGLLLIKEFMNLHHLQLTSGVFSEEANVERVGGKEREILLQLQEYNNNNNNKGEMKVSLLEKIIMQALQNIPPLSSSSSSSSSSETIISTHDDNYNDNDKKEEDNNKQIKQNNSNNNNNNKQKQKNKKEENNKLEPPHHPEITDELKEYEDSVNFSDESFNNASSLDESLHDHIEKF